MTARLTRSRQAFVWSAIALVAGLLLWALGPVLAPFIISAILAYVLHPLVERMTRRRVPRWLAVGIAVLLAVVVAAGVLLLLVPILTTQLPQLRDQLPQLVGRINELVTPLLARVGIHASLDGKSIQEFIAKYVSENGQELWNRVLDSARIGGSYLLALVGNAILVPMVLYYLLLDWPQMLARLRNLVPQRMREQVLGFVDECDELIGQYLRGQLLVMVVLAAYYAIALSIAGFDLAIPVGVFTGLAICIPYLGFGLGLVMAILAALLQFQSWYGIAAVAGIYGVGQTIESFFLTPHLVGERIGLHPVAVIFALLAFGHLFGFVGVLIALPASALLMVAWRRLLIAYRRSPLYLS